MGIFLHKCFYAPTILVEKKKKSENLSFENREENTISLAIFCNLILYFQQFIHTALTEANMA